MTNQREHAIMSARHVLKTLKQMQAELRESGSLSDWGRKIACAIDYQMTAIVELERQ